MEHPRYTCDGPTCDRETTSRRPIADAGWIIVKVATPGERSRYGFRMEEEHRHFCADKCLREWYEVQALEERPLSVSAT